MPNRSRCTLYLTPMHAAIDKRMTLIANIRAALSHISSVAEQLPQANRLRTFVNYGVAKNHPTISALATARPTRIGR